MSEYVLKFDVSKCWSGSVRFTGDGTDDVAMFLFEAIKQTGKPVTLTKIGGTQVIAVANQEP